MIRFLSRHFGRGEGTRYVQEVQISKGDKPMFDLNVCQKFHVLQVFLKEQNFKEKIVFSFLNFLDVIAHNPPLPAIFANY